MMAWNLQIFQQQKNTSKLRCEKFSDEVEYIGKIELNYVSIEKKN